MKTRRLDFDVVWVITYAAMITAAALCRTGLSWTEIYLQSDRNQTQSPPKPFPTPPPAATPTPSPTPYQEIDASFDLRRVVRRAAIRGLGIPMSDTCLNLAAEHWIQTARLSVPWRPELLIGARLYSVPTRVLGTLIMVESEFNHLAISRAGAVGWTQLMPATARMLGVRNRRDPIQSSVGGACYMRMNFQRFGSWSLAAVAFHGGPSRVSAPLESSLVYAEKVMSGSAQ